MRTFRLPLQLGLLSLLGLTLALAGCAPWVVQNEKVGYALDNKDGTLAVFTCTDASDGQCYLKVGAANGAATRSLAVRVGEKVELPVSSSENALCYSARPDIDWQACPTSDRWVDLSRTGSSSGFRFSRFKIG